MTSTLVPICGLCDYPASWHHTYNGDKRISTVCNRDVLEILPDGKLDHRDHDSNGYIWSDYYLTDNDRSSVMLMPEYEGPEARMVRGGLIMDGIATDRAATLYDGSGYSVKEMLEDLSILYPAEFAKLTDQQINNLTPIQPSLDGAPLSGIGASDYDDPNSRKWLLEETKIENWRDASYSESRNAETGTVTKSWDCTSILTFDEDGNPIQSDSPEVRITHKSNPKWSKTYVQTPEPLNPEPQFISHNAFVEGFDGFTTEQTFDMDKTLKHHARLLNVYRKNGNLRTGSIEFTFSPDGKQVKAQCVKDSCQQYRIETIPLPDPATGEYTDESLDLMIDFTYGAMAHGNNHAAFWFQSKKVHLAKCKAHTTGKSRDCNHKDCIKTWYKIHHWLCADPATCSTHAAGCANRITSEEYADRIWQRELKILAEAINSTTHNPYRERTAA